MRKTRTWIGKGLALAASLALGLWAADGRAQSFQTAAPYALLMDFDSGTVLFEKAADELMVPASMVKIMTAEVVFHEIKQGKLGLDAEFVVSENAWRKGGAPSRGSSMFARLGERIKVADLLRGLIVQSGNDAAIILAEGIAGSEDNFARMMTVRAREIGLTRSAFRNATGFHHPEQKVTARELARLSAHIVETYPDLYPMFGEREFTWNRIRQENRLPLLAMDIGADGLKTGNVDESGFGLVGSAVQNGQRLIVVVNGLKTARDRAAESRKLLDWGFRAFEPREIFGKGEVVGEARVYGGTRSGVPLVARNAVRVLVPRGSNERLTLRIVYMGPIKPPVRQGAQVARLRATRGDVQALDLPLYAAEDVGVGNLQQRAVDGLLEWGSGMVRRVFTKG
jgi:serine-type D-Ala-D-Ala carboxypeptidase (penicillin-binding protein 5/6)